MRIANVTNSAGETTISWNNINWQEISKQVTCLRQRIYRATAEGNLKKVRNLQKLLLRATANKLWAIRRVTQINQGKHTAGVDNKIVTTPKEREHLYSLLSTHHKVKSQPVRRVYILKRNGKKRPLGIPTIVDRCRQAIVKTALEPYWEAKFEIPSYGFRPGRSAHDAIQKIFCITRTGKSREWILDADIKGAFDNIDHAYLMKCIGNFPARSEIRQWLTAGVMEGNTFTPSVTGTPQGGIISPLLANIALHGMESMLGISYDNLGRIKKKSDYAFVRYADDFAIFAKTHEQCEQAKLELQEWLALRGLELSKEKTHIRHISEGFDFLGFNIRQYPSRGKKRGKILLIKPSKESIKTFRKNIRQIWKKLLMEPTEKVIACINPKIMGWGNYFRVCSASKTFNALDHWMWTRQSIFARRRHPNKHWWWLKRYWGKIKGRNDRWVFKDKKTGKYLWKLAWIPIKHHVLTKGQASPDNPALREYWKKRQENKRHYLFANKSKLWKKQKGVCLNCRMPLDNDEQIHVHHIIPKSKGGTDQRENLCLLHRACHVQLHSNLKSAEARKLLEPYAG